MHSGAGIVTHYKIAHRSLFCMSGIQKVIKTFCFTSEAKIYLIS